jgi:hypothetical protein
MRVHQGGDVVRHVAVGRRDTALERVAREDDFPGTPGPSMSDPEGIPTD